MAEIVIRAGRRKGFTTVFRSAAQDKRLSLKARGLFLLMQSLPDGWRYTVSGLAALAGTGKDQIRSGLKELTDVGYLVKEQSHDPGGKFSGNIYILQEESPLSENPTTVQKSAAPLSGKPSTGKPSTEKPSTENPTLINNIYTNYDKKPPIVPQGTESEMLFERFWSAYPRRQYKDRARKAWAKLGPDLALCRRMSEALAIQKRSAQWTEAGGKYIPHPATWLNGRCWEDDPGPMAAPPNPQEIPPDDERRGRYL